MDRTGGQQSSEGNSAKSGRIRRWAPIEEMESRFLRVVLLPDRETVHNVFFDRGFKP
jgi:hypothetical protein